MSSSSSTGAAATPGAPCEARPHRTIRARRFERLHALMAAHPRAANANLDHPYFAREMPRTMLIDEMEAIWAPIAEADDWSAFDQALGEIEEMREAYSAAAAAG